MNRRFRWIKDDEHLRKLRKIEHEREDAIAARCSRSMQLRRIAELLHDEVKGKLAAGITLHDENLRFMALNLCRQNNIENFKASQSWITAFKRRYGIVSRKITTFVTKRNYRSREEIQRKAQEFVSIVRREMEAAPLGCFCNGDQSGFVKELTTGRSLAPVGVKRVERTVESRTAMTHSYTILPILYADGRLGEKLYVVLQERGGEFPRHGHFEAPNLVVRAATSHIMTKELMVDWIKSCLFNSSSVQETTHLIVDSWSSFRDVDTIRKAVPEGVQHILLLHS
ncbi:tc5 transposase [Cooperia oncophora]